MVEYIKRSMDKTLTEVHDVFPVISLTGPRQSGKTTLCRHLYPDIPYVNMENIHTANLFVEDPVGYINSFKEGVSLSDFIGLGSLKGLGSLGGYR